MSPEQTDLKDHKPAETTESQLFENVTLDPPKPKVKQEKPAQNRALQMNIPDAELTTEELAVRYKTRYTESTKGALQLKEERDAAREEAEEVKRQLESVEDVKPFIERVKTDPDFAKHMLKYFNESDTSVEPAEFEGFDADELSDPNSKSHQIFKKAVKAEAEKIVDDKLNDFNLKKTKQENVDKMRQKYLIKHPDKDESYLDELESRARKVPWDYDIMEQLVDRDKERNKIAKQVRDDIDKQVDTVNQIPSTLSNVSNTPEEKPSEKDKLFATIKATVDKTNPLG